MRRTIIRSIDVVRLLVPALLCALAPAPAIATEPADSPTGSKANVLARYVLLAHSDVVERTVPLVRAVVAQPADACPSVERSDGVTVSMHVRHNPAPAAFGPTVCEAVVELPAGVTAQLAGQPLPIPAADQPKPIDRLVVLGDSGCKVPKQDCSTGWALPAIAKAAAADAPDLVIHVGDYNYRGTPNKTAAGEWSYDGCVPKDGGPIVRNALYDTWVSWDADFFTPMEPLLAAAPWVVVRGNHELCSRGGRGWFYLLDPHSPLLNPWVRQPSCDAGTEPTAPYRLQFANLDLVVLDTANACGGEDPESPAGVAYELDLFRDQLAAVNAMTRSGQPTWLLAHRPIWSLARWSADDPPTSENQTLQPALRATPTGTLADPIALVVSGHMHQFFTATFTGKTGRPPQLVVGNSGVELSGNLLASPYELPIDGEPAAGLSLASGPVYGYLRADLTDGGHWSGTVPAFDAAGTAQAKPVATCGLPIQDGRLCR